MMDGADSWLHHHWASGVTRMDRAHARNRSKLDCGKLVANLINPASCGWLSVMTRQQCTNKLISCWQSMSGTVQQASQSSTFRKYFSLFISGMDTVQAAISHEKRR
jgi:hypothetical protein